jgi:rod shape determining protein RodA
MHNRSFIDDFLGDKVFLCFFLLIAVFGLFVQFSASGQTLDSIYGQAIKIILALICFLFFSKVNVSQIKVVSLGLFIATIALLLMVSVVGVTINGSTRWIDLLLFRFQPSEIVKLSLPMMLAWYIDYREFKLTPADLTIIVLLIILPFYLIYEQPDLGTALLVVFSGAVVIFFIGIRWRYIFFWFFVTFSSIPFIWNILEPYQKSRILVFLNPSSDPLGAGYNILQSQIAIGSGGLFGKGWLNGSQVQLEFLPEQSTDFIFAVIGEEFGLVGITLLLVMYLVLIGRCFLVSHSASGTYSRMLSASIAMILFFAVFINIGMVIGILPVVGVPLPFISQGGTSMITMMIALGIVSSINRERKLVEG